MENLFVKGQYLAKTGDTRGSGSAMRGYVVATENIEKTEGASPTSKALSMEELHINQESTTPINEKTLVKGNFKLKQAALGISGLKRFKGTLLKFLQRIRELFSRPNPALFHSISIFKKYPDLLKLLRENESLDEGIDEFMKKILNDHSQKENVNLELYEADAAKLKQSLHNLHNILKENAKDYNIKIATTKQMSRDLQPILPPKRQTWQPVILLAGMMAPYQSKALVEDQQIIRSHLPDDQAYLSQLFGFMGPKDVLEPWFEVAIGEMIESKEFQFSGQEVDFGSELGLLQSDLAALVRLHRSSDLSNKKTNAEISNLNQKAILEKIDAHENKLNNNYFPN
ncbi:hypothetical protein PCASD_13569 [Puccinia coronata f. sp. avenae]|uniref:Uncharacterized protein n=1 Tax=Puccinia coronata f. sp. avenae TaxID=200324 RepID=A0A2N5TDW6_9BASI|nr:hypothetical protein PCASD_13569 [Puccinia coronata f. sp. avenae]